MAKAFTKYCKLNLYTFEKTSGNSYATRLKTKLESGPSPMTCTQKSNVYECRGVVTGSSEPVRIYFKSDMKNPTSLSVHFHGHYSDSEGTKAGSYPFSAANGNYAQMLEQSKSQAILIVPESKGKVLTYKKDFATAAQWSKWIQGVESRLGLDPKLPMTLSGHSGADAILNSIGSFCAAHTWDCSRVKSLGLFDANYGELRNGGLVGRDGLKSLVSSTERNQGTIFIRDTEDVGLTNANKALVAGVNSSRLNVKTIKTKHMAIMKDGDFSTFLDL